MRFKASISALLVVMIFAAGAFGATLTDYADRVRIAQGAASDLQKAASSGPISKDAEERLLGIIETSLPETEKVDAPGTTIATDYAWLHEDINQYRAAKTIELRREILDSLTARLQAIKDGVLDLVEAEKAAPGAPAPKQ